MTPHLYSLPAARALRIRKSTMPTPLVRVESITRDWGLYSPNPDTR